MKLCKDCKWFLPEPNYPTLDRCGKFITTKNVPDLVLGGQKAEFTNNKEYASMHRMWGWPSTWLLRACGKSGRWWEPK